MSQVGDQPATGVRDERHSPGDRPLADAFLPGPVRSAEVRARLR
jgi:hypothetical protein